nr:thiamine phosphate synthase [Granulicella arctica]
MRYAITDRSLFPGDEPQRRSALVRQAALLSAEGVDLLQLREKDLPAATLASLALTLLQTLRSSGTKLIINTRADIAVATCAHGVHLTSSLDELPPRQIHDLYAQANLPAPIVTLSCHTLQDVVRHRLEPLSAILFGPVFEKSVSGEYRTEGTGLALLQQACAAAAPIPVLALGGITPDNLPTCLQAGASGIAGIRLFQRH